MRSDAHRMRAFLGYRGIVDHQHGIAAADELIRLNQQLCLHRPGIPDPGRDEVVQLIVVTSCNPLRHWLNALAIARADQSLTRRAGTFVAVLCDPTDPETA